LKLPFFVVCAVAGIAMLVTGAYVLGGVVFVASAGAAVVVACGRNPWWMRSPLDRRAAKKR
jgi:hypothetical protein